MEREIQLVVEKTFNRPLEVLWTENNITPCVKRKSLSSGDSIPNKSFQSELFNHFFYFEKILHVEQKLLSFRIMDNRFTKGHIVTAMFTKGAINQTILVIAHSFLPTAIFNENKRRNLLLIRKMHMEKDTVLPENNQVTGSLSGTSRNSKDTTLTYRRKVGNGEPHI